MPRASLPGLALLAALLAAAASAAATHATEDFRITLAPGQAPAASGTGGTRVTTLNVSADMAEFALVGARDHLHGTVVSEGWVKVERARQLVPESIAKGIPDDDWHFFHLVQQPWDAERASWARVLNTTKDGDRVTMRLAMPVNATTAEARLRLTLDVTPPTVGVGPITNVTHFSFYVESTTDEYALANLLVRPAGGGAEPVPNPTPMLALIQRFPVQGLKARTEYVFHVEAEDWAGNTARSPDRALTTAEAPVRPAPTIVAHWPPRNATLDASPASITVNFTGPAPRGLQDVRVFLDKVPLPDGHADLRDGQVIIRPPAALAPGRHSVGVEITSAEGGTAVESWAFTVAGGAARTPGMPLAWLLAGGVAALLARRRAA